MEEPEKEGASRPDSASILTAPRSGRVTRSSATTTTGKSGISLSAPDTRDVSPVNETARSSKSADTAPGAAGSLTPAKEKRVLYQ